VPVRRREWVGEAAGEQSIAARTFSPVRELSDSGPTVDPHGEELHLPQPIARVEDSRRGASRRGRRRHEHGHQEETHHEPPEHIRILRPSFTKNRLVFPKHEISTRRRRIASGDPAAP